MSGDAVSAAALALSAMTIPLWIRPPNHRREEGISQGGLMGPCRLTGSTWALADVLLLLGEAFGAGGHTALGLGRYRLEGLVWS